MVVQSVHGEHTQRVLTLVKNQLSIIDMVRLILFTAVVFLSPVSGHQDTRLELNGTEISGLPGRYKSAAFVDGGKALMINGKKLRFPEVIVRMLCFEPKQEKVKEPEPFEENAEVVEAVDLSGLELWSSWYHFPSRLPPYLSIRKTDEDKGVGFAVLINLEDVSIIEAHVSVRDSRDWWIEFPVAIEEPPAPEPAPVGMEAISGQWRSLEVHIELTVSSINTTGFEGPYIALTGKISQKEPGIFVLENPDSTRKDVNYSLSGDILTLWWGQRRSGIQSVEVAKVGGKTDTLYRSLIGADKEPQEGNDR
jgi:hypothetical protein